MNPYDRVVIYSTTCDDSLEWCMDSNPRLSGAMLYIMMKGLELGEYCF